MLPTATYIVNKEKDGPFSLWKRFVAGVPPFKFKVISVKSYWKPVGPGSTEMNEAQSPVGGGEGRQSNGQL